MRHVACGALLACALVALAGAASAQQPDPQNAQNTFVEKKTSDGQDIRFKDDPIGALGNDPIGAQLTGFHPPRRYDLMRPRTTFVPQMLKTVENL
jgi:hypothetical protein